MNNINNINNVNKYIDITTGKQFSTGGKSYHIQHLNAKLSDEFYSSNSFVIKCMNRINKSVFIDKVIYMPCDSDDSEFVKYFIKNKDSLQYKELIHTSDDMFTHKDLFDKCDLVITNPPFSKVTQMIKFIGNKDYILVDSFMSSVGLHYRKRINSTIMIRCVNRDKDWTNTKKTVCTSLISNLPKDIFIKEDYKKKKPHLIGNISNYNRYIGGTDYSDYIGETLAMPYSSYIVRFCVDELVNTIKPPHEFPVAIVKITE